jgi:hypothetical protein
MSKARSLYTIVAAGDGPGGPWRLLWPAWKWARLTPEQQTAVIADQAERFRGGENGKIEGRLEAGNNEGGPDRP